MYDFKIFEIPIYYRSFDKFCSDWDKKKEKELADYLKSSENSLSKPSEKNIEEYKTIIEQHFWKPWYYNDIIAWIYIECHSYHITADFYQKKRKKSGYFEHYDKIGETHIHSNMSSAQIAKELTEMIDGIAACKEIKKDWYIDRLVFDKLVNRVNWRSLLI